MRSCSLLAAALAWPGQAGRPGRVQGGLGAGEAEKQMLWHEH